MTFIILIGRIVGNQKEILKYGIFVFLLFNLVVTSKIFIFNLSQLIFCVVLKSYSVRG